MADCTKHSSLADFISSGDFFDGVVCAFTDSGVVSESLLGFWVISALALGFYFYSGSVVLPLVLAIILGGFWINFVVGPAMAVLTVALLIVIPAAGWILYQQFER